MEEEEESLWSSEVSLTVNSQHEVLLQHGELFRKNGQERTEREGEYMLITGRKAPRMVFTTGLQCHKKPAANQLKVLNSVHFCIVIPSI